MVLCRSLHVLCRLSEFLFYLRRQETAIIWKKN